MIRIPSLLAALAVGAFLNRPPAAEAQQRRADPPGYAGVRAGLIARGYRPLRFPDATLRERCFTRAEICNAYPETESCAGTGLGQCLFVFAAPRGGYHTVTTGGEALSELHVLRSGPASARAAREYRDIPRP